MINLKRSNGTLLQTENVNVSSGRENQCKAINLDKGQPAETFSEQSVVDGMTIISETPLPIEPAPSLAPQAPPTPVIHGSQTRSAPRSSESRVENVAPVVPAAFDYYAE